ncbi:translocation and assembly module lipoprotein TamL, partial [Phocaeicola plebeius]
FFYKDKLFLRPQVISDYNYLQSGKLYRNRDVQNTYSALGRLNILKYSNIRFREELEADSAYLDAYVMLTRNKNKSLSFEFEGTNSAGDLGAAASVAYSHRNLFKGSETFTIKLRGAYEAVTGLEGYANSNYLEYGVETSLSFPEFMFPFLSSDFRRRSRATSEVTVKYNWQIRPEFERTVASAAWSYRWGKRGATHRFDVFDLNYIYMPYRSETFREYLDYMDERNPLLRYSYEDLFIVRLGYTYTYNSSGATTLKTSQRNSYSIRFNIEESGNLLYLFSRMINGSPKNGEAYQMANISFAQYVKTDFDYAKNFMIDDRNALVFHVGVGVAVPYGNSKSLPFEKLYFSGGANSVRGWSVRSLGPGGYRGDSNSLDYVNHTGDIKLDLNLEYRTHLFWKLNGAAFVDAGNVWTIRNREMQPEGLFKFNRFYKQLAVAYGLGLRFDLDFLIIRFDGGMKAINPMYTGRDRYPIISPDFKRDFAFHFAVGYPF